MRMMRRMKTFPRLSALLAAALLGLVACAADGAPPAAPEEFPMKIRLSVGDQVATATLYDNTTARDFATLLPLTLTMNDYARIERVADLPRKLSTRGAPEGMAPVAGELTHYAPWGNLALFIEGRTWSRSLLPLGKVDDGLPLLSQPGPYSVRIERVEP